MLCASMARAIRSSFWGGRPQDSQQEPSLNSFPGPCQDSRGSLMAEAGSEEAFGQTSGELEGLEGEAG